MKRTAIVIGAGLGGLATAARLQSAGYQVTVFDRREGPGGKAYTQAIGPYRFDTGPSLLTLLPVFERLFRDVGRDLHDYLTVEPLQEICRYYWPDGVATRTVAGAAALAERLQHDLAEPADNTLRFLRHCERIWDITTPLFLHRSLHEFATYRGATFWRSMLRLWRIDPLRTLAEAVDACFVTPHARQLFKRYATYNGSDPFKTPATLATIVHAEYGLGAWSVRGGIYRIPRALERVARELGVAFVYNSPVEAIVTQGERVRGVRVGDRGYRADVVVSNADVRTTYEHLLHDADAPRNRRYRELEPSSSGLVLYLGVGRGSDRMGLHTIAFSGDYRREFDAIFRRDTCPEDPTLYINITSKGGAPDDAPNGAENWFVLVNAPAARGQDWEREYTRVRARALERLSAVVGWNVSDHIEAEDRLLPTDIERLTASRFGSLYGISSNTARAAFLRHPNRSRRYRGLYFVGGSAHPGGGMPLVVLSAQITAALIARHA